MFYKTFRMALFVSLGFIAGMWIQGIILQNTFFFFPKEELEFSLSETKFGPPLIPEKYEYKIIVNNDTLEESLTHSISYQLSAEDAELLRKNPTFSTVSNVIYLDHCLQSEHKSFFSESAETYTLK